MIKFNNKAKNNKYNYMNLKHYLMLQPDEIFNILGTKLIS